VSKRRQVGDVPGLAKSLKDSKCVQWHDHSIRRSGYRRIGVYVRPVHHGTELRITVVEGPRDETSAGPQDSVHYDGIRISEALTTAERRSDKLKSDGHHLIESSSGRSRSEVIGRIGKVAARAEAIQACGLEVG